MTLLLEEAFDDGLHGYRQIGGGTPNTSYGKDGSRGVRLGDNPNSYIRIRGGIDFPSHSTDTVVFGFWHYTQTNDTSNVALVRFRDTEAASNHLEVKSHIDGSLDFVCGSGTFSTSAGALPAAQWAFVEIKVKVNATTGTIDCWIDNSSVLSETGKDTYGSGGTYVNYVQLGDFAGSLREHWCDSWYLLNTAGSAPFNDRLGPVRIYQDLPDGNGNTSGLTGSDGNSVDNYDLVNDLTASTATYNGSATEGAKDTYSFGNLPSVPSSILGVTISTLTEKNDVGVKYGRVVTRSGGTDYPETSVALSQGYSLDRVVIQNDPNTAAAWTESGYNAAEHGWEVRNS